MDAPTWPTFGRMLQYLTDRGFVLDRAHAPGHVFAVYTNAANRWFVFRDRPLEAPARGIELVSMRSQLDWWGLVSFSEFSRFWTEHGPRQPEPISSGPIG